jgi:hypothetical protein
MLGIILEFCDSAEFKLDGGAGSLRPGSGPKGFAPGISSH